MRLARERRDDANDQEEEQPRGEEHDGGRQAGRTYDVLNSRPVICTISKRSVPCTRARSILS